MNKAFLVGINNYSALNELQGCVNDITDTADFLVSRCGFKQDDIRLLSDERATARNIRERLAWLVAEVASGDRIYFHYSGHGTQIATRNKKGEPDGYDEVICPVDFDFDSEQSMIRDKEFLRIFKGVPEGVSFVWVSDSCFSGGLSRGILPKNARYKTYRLPVDIAWRNSSAEIRQLSPLGIKGAAKKLNAVLLSGCAETQESADAEFNGRYNGAFTYYMLKNLKTTKGMKRPLTQLVTAIGKDLKKGRFTQQPELLGSDIMGLKPFLSL